MQPKTTIKTTIIIAAGAIFAALVAIATYLFVIPIPATTGYFNLGETVIYTAALVLGPFVGAFAGGGAAIADLLVPGGAVFAPATLVIKALEGFTVGTLNKKLFHKTQNITLSATVSVVLGGLIMIFGYFTYEVAVLGYPVAAALIELPFNVVQMVIGLIVAVPIMYAVLRVFPQLKSQI
ncbi:MAG: ECF transporter S component [Candidatus Bathyarchaeota archaeon]|nr:ECF transporter S component [Candidatus Bathyarchaeota archaeon]